MKKSTTPKLKLRGSSQEAIAEYDKQHTEACKGAWIPFTDGFRCSKCQYDSRYMFTKCLGCGAEMKNGTVD